MRGAAPQLGHDGRDPAEDVGQRGARDPGHQDVAGRDAAELALAAHHAGPSRRPADPRGVPFDAAMAGRRFVPDLCRFEPERARLQQLEAGPVEGPLDLDGEPEHFLRTQEEAAELADLRSIEADPGHGLLARNAPLMRAAGALLGTAPLDTEKLRAAPEQVAIGQRLALRNRGTQARRRGEKHSSGSRVAEPSA